jgi:hypothetical protein
VKSVVIYQVIILSLVKSLPFPNKHQKLHSSGDIQCPLVLELSCNRVMLESVGSNSALLLCVQLLVPIIAPFSLVCLQIQVPYQPGKLKTK